MGEACTNPACELWLSRLFVFAESSSRAMRSTMLQREHHIKSEILQSKDAARLSSRHDQAAQYESRPSLSTHPAGSLFQGRFCRRAPQTRSSWRELYRQARYAVMYQNRLQEHPSTSEHLTKAHRQLQRKCAMNYVAIVSERTRSPSKIFTNPTKTPDARISHPGIMFIKNS
jgi:hypothetical protein